MGPHHYHIDEIATALRRENGMPGIVLVGCELGEDCEGPQPAFDLVTVRRVWRRDGA